VLDEDSAEWPAASLIFIKLKACLATKCSHPEHRSRIEKMGRKICVRAMSAFPAEYPYGRPAAAGPLRDMSCSA
jgi:hypothetical protein